MLDSCAAIATKGNEMYSKYQEDRDMLSEHSFIHDLDGRYGEQLMEYAEVAFLRVGKELPDRASDKDVNLFKEVLFRCSPFKAMVRAKLQWITPERENPGYNKIADTLARYIIYTKWEYIVGKVRYALSS